ncbi:transketolase [Verrucomicrobiota bacterium]
MKIQRESQREIRRIILQQSHRAGVGHIGSALSVADILVSLYEDFVRPGSAGDQDRDRFVLSKGHAALALYSILQMRGIIEKEALDTYCADNSLLGVHPDNQLNGVDFASGSLGHGLSITTGAALAARMQSASRKVYALLSDAECNEGSLWEAAMFAAHHKLSALTAVIDRNGCQALGHTQDVLNLEPLGEKWRSFGWLVGKADGHNVDALSKTIADLQKRGAAKKKPQVLIAKTVIGKGVSFMEGQIKWHYWPLSEEEFQQAMTEVG